MVFQNIKLNHEVDDFKEALGLTKSLMNVCRERIFFSHFANNLMAIELYDSKDAAPNDLTTISGDLQRCLKMITDPLEYEATLLFFSHYHEIAIHAFKYWKLEHAKDLTVEQKLKLSILKLTLEAAKKKVERENKENVLLLSDLVQRIDVVVKSNYNFSKYMKIIGIPYDDGTSQVDDMLKDLFKDGD